MIYIDNEDIHDPRINLAIEEFALHHLDSEQDYLLLYVNRPSIIIGRNQNPFAEINFKNVWAKQIPVLRRVSGGGTVYHDNGNLNFSFITSYNRSKLHNFKYFNTPIVTILRNLGVEAELNDHNDIIVKGKKLSGNAQHSAKGRMFSHGTLLFDSDLKALNTLLQDRFSALDTKATQSRRSHVTNISRFVAPGFSINDLKSELIKGLIGSDSQTNTYRLRQSDWERIRYYCMKRYNSWEWNFGKTPRFTLNRKDGETELNAEIEHGTIKELRLSGNFLSDKDSRQFSKLMVGKKFYPSDLATEFKSEEISKITNRISTEYLLSLFFDLPSSKKA